MKNALIEMNLSQNVEWQNQAGKEYIEKYIYIKMYIIYLLNIQNWLGINMYLVKVSELHMNDKY